MYSIQIGPERVAFNTLILHKTLIFMKILKTLASICLNFFKAYLQILIYILINLLHDCVSSKFIRIRLIKDHIYTYIYLECGLTFDVLRHKIETLDTFFRYT